MLGALARKALRPGAKLKDFAAARAYVLKTLGGDRAGNRWWRSKIPDLAEARLVKMRKRAARRAHAVRP